MAPGTGSPHRQATPFTVRYFSGCHGLAVPAEPLPASASGPRRRTTAPPSTARHSCEGQLVSPSPRSSADSPGGVPAAESAELRNLRRRNKLLEQENEVLRRAAAFFAREISPR